MAGIDLDRLADLAVSFGANVQPGQIVGVTGEVEHAPLVRRIAARAYEKGARFVDVGYFDPYVKRARVAHAPDGTLEFVPPWYGERWLALGREQAAYIGVSGPSEPGLLADLDQERAGLDRLPMVKESLQVINERTVNWSIVPYATAGWARTVHPELDEEAALEKLWQQLAHVCRLDEPDPVAAWERRMEATVGASERLTQRRFDAIHFEGEGTDLRIGLLRSSRWFAARFETTAGLVHHPNLPTEEVFTTPDPAATEGVVRATKPLVFSDGGLVRGLRVRFEAGVAVEIEADEGAENLRARTGEDDGGRRLGEVALVDGDGRIGPLGTVFYDTLLDENAASHIAFGRGFDFACGDEDKTRVNQSATHIDFMIGGDGVDVTGITADGERVPVLVRGAWQI
ncbi:MAG: aminopeptidase [Actinomycetota bacterium]|nr:aminopeptidase [Actinomycetota bacterium]